MTRNLIEEAFRRGHAATTVVLAVRWLRTHPQDLGIMLDYAEMLYRMTRYDEAIRIYEHAMETLDLDGNGRWAICNQLGHMYQYWGRPAEAESWFRQAIACEPDELASYIFLGACQARQGKLQEAEATYLVATKEADSSLLDEAYQNLGLVCRGQGRLAEAAEWFRKALELDPVKEDAIRALQDVEVALALSAEGNV